MVKTENIESGTFGFAGQLLCRESAIPDTMSRNVFLPYSLINLGMQRWDLCETLRNFENVLLLIELESGGVEVIS